MKTLFVGILITLAACAPVKHKIDVQSIHNDTLVSCHNKLENHDLVYLKSMRHDETSNIFPTVILSNIIDIDKVSWTINSMEWPTYICTEKQIL